MQYNQYKEEQAKLMSDSTCFCLPLRSGVLAIGLIGSTLAISGIAAYAIVQVPTIRVQVGQYFINTTFPYKQEVLIGDDYNLMTIAYSAEIVGVFIGASLGLLANILLIFGVSWSRRWFFIHWLLFHLLVLIILFITSIILFVVQISLWKLVGIIPVMVAIFSMYCWTKVYELFCSLRPISDDELHPPTCKLHPHAQIAPQFVQHPHQSEWVEDREEREASMDKLGEVGPGMEFYPVDPLSKGMMDRLRVFNMSMSNMVYLPYEDVEDSPYQRRSHSRENYQVQDDVEDMRAKTKNNEEYDLAAVAI